MFATNNIENMKNIIFIFISFLLIGCGEKRKVKEAYAKMCATNIVFPETAQVTYNGKDTVIADFYTAQMKQVVFVDSMDCTSCIISKLALWKPMFEYSASLDNSIKFYFVLTPAAKKEQFVKSSLKGYILDYPVIIDSKREFLALNPHIPKDKTFHTFLLDADNKVMFVGSPIANDAIRQLFFEATQNNYKEFKKERINNTNLSIKLTN